MSEAFISSCKVALHNLIASDKVCESADPYASFSDGIMNFHAHYCRDDHTSFWCHHDKVCLDMYLPYTRKCDLPEHTHT